jgi:NtrC-family two-component system response regulator AlgB
MAADTGGSAPKAAAAPAGDPQPAMAEPAPGAPGPWAPATPRPFKVLVIDDEREMRDALSISVRMLGCKVDAAETSDAALARVRVDSYALAFCDLMLGDGNGIDLVPKLLALNPNLQIIVVTGFATFETAVKAVKAGASDYLQKPFDPAQIRRIVEQAIDDHRQAEAFIHVERHAQKGLDGMVWSSRSPTMQAACSIISRAAQAAVPVLLRGESGTGKGMFARALHAQSARAEQPFITVNCPALTDELLTSELFGHAKGSFTGAVKDQVGKVEVADGGTLFLDELGELSLGVQAKLLRFLQEHRYERLGDTVTRQADVRIVAATNRDLAVQVREGRFREDLLYRLNVVELALPPLRERREDILEIARRFLAIVAAAANRPVQELSATAQALLLSYSWPGNIRELRNELQRISVLWPSRVIEPEAFSPRIFQHDRQGPQLGEKHSLADIEHEHIRKVLAKSNSFEEAATILGIEPSTLWRKRRKLGL